MVQLMESGRGTDKSIPQMILAGASCDDIFVIVLFTTFLHTAQGGSANAADFLSIPASIVLGVALGALVGWLLSRFFETAYARAHCIRNSMKVIIVLGGLAAARRGGGLARGHRAGVGTARGRQHGVLT